MEWTEIQDELAEAKLMTVAEMTNRLQAGEDKLELAIEKWERLIAALRSGYEVATLRYAYDGDTCALCSEGCENCSYYQHYGYRCDDDDDGEWETFHKEKTVANAIAMHDALIVLREE